MEWLHETMLLEVDPLTKEELEEHLANVKSIAEEYMDVVVG